MHCDVRKCATKVINTSIAIAQNQVKENEMDIRDIQS